MNRFTEALKRSKSHADSVSEENQPPVSTPQSSLCFLCIYHYLMFSYQVPLRNLTLRQIPFSPFLSIPVTPSVRRRLILNIRACLHFLASEIMAPIMHLCLPKTPLRISTDLSNSRMLVGLLNLLNNKLCRSNHILEFRPRMPTIWALRTLKMASTLVNNSMVPHRWRHRRQTSRCRCKSPDKWPLMLRIAIPLPILATRAFRLSRLNLLRLNLNSLHNIPSLVTKRRLLLTRRALRVDLRISPFHLWFHRPRATLLYQQVQ